MKFLGGDSHLASESKFASICEAGRNVHIYLSLIHICYGQIPVISLSVQGIEKNEGFKFTPALLVRALQGVIYGDLFMRVLYRVRPYEKVKGAANHLHEVWKKRCIKSLEKARYGEFKKNIRGIIRDFDRLPIIDEKKPRVGIDVYKRQPITCGSPTTVFEDNTWSIPLNKEFTVVSKFCLSIVRPPV